MQHLVATAIAIKYAYPAIRYELKRSDRVDTGMSNASLNKKTEAAIDVGI